MNQPLFIDYYSDILCVWAWVAQQRIEELNQKLENKIHFKYHYLDIFGDVQKKLRRNGNRKVNIMVLQSMYINLHLSVMMFPQT